MELAAAEVAELLAGTSFAERPPVVPVSAHTGEGLDELRRVIRAVESAARMFPGIMFHSPLRAGDDAPVEAAGVLLAWRERQRARLAGAVAEGQRRGHFRDDLDPAVAAAVGLAFALGCGALSQPVDAGAWMVDYCAWP